MQAGDLTLRLASTTRNLLKPLRSWFEQKAKRYFPRCYWEHEIKTIEKHFEKILEDAKQKGRWQDYQMAEEARDSETEMAEMELSTLASRKLLRRANRVGVRLSDVALPKGDNQHLREGYIPGQRHLHHDSYTSLQKLVEQAERQGDKERRERWESWSKIVVPVLAAIASLIGVLIGLVSILKK